jgi:hypothetical protein
VLQLRRISDALLPSLIGDLALVDEAPFQNGKLTATMSLPSLSSGTILHAFIDSFGDGDMGDIFVCV